jgi:hypothetical protein
MRCAYSSRPRTRPGTRGQTASTSGVTTVGTRSSATPGLGAPQNARQPSTDQPPPRVDFADADTMPSRVPGCFGGIDLRPRTRSPSITSGVMADRSKRGASVPGLEPDRPPRTGRPRRGHPRPAFRPASMRTALLLGRRVGVLAIAVVPWPCRPRGRPHPGAAPFRRRGTHPHGGGSLRLNPPRLTPAMRS